MTVLAYLSGRADPRRPGLPETQVAFLKAVAARDMHVLGAGWPFHKESPQEGPVPLPIASWRSLRAWARARQVAGFTRDGLRRLGDGSTVITGSCGLDLLVAVGRLEQVKTVVALGPVCRRPKWPGVRLVTVIGIRDGLSRAMHLAPADVSVPCGHLGYLTCPRTRSVVRRVLAE
ncbi:MAG: hypothetical protein AAFQ64_13615 [Pseudomonadota bacterium]